MTREQSLEDILQRLVDLKDHKDKYGKDEHYQSEQPVLWQIARERLASDGDLADVVNQRELLLAFIQWWQEKDPVQTDSDPWEKSVDRFLSQ